jgi:hypothetical protein
MAVGTFRNTAVVQSNEDPAGPNNTATADTTVEISTIGVKFFTVTSTNEKNVLEWVNPTDAYYATTEIRWSNVGFPANETQGNLLYNGNDGGGSGGRWKISHDTGAFSNGLIFYYAAFVHRSSAPPVSPGRFCTGRPFDSTVGPVKWSFSTGATAVSPPTVGGAGVIAPSNDRVLYAMERGPLPPGGQWPATWRPVELQDVVQSRSPVVPVDVLGANPVAYLGVQDGNVYAVDATRGGTVPLLWQTALPLASMVQAAPAGIFSEFDPTLTFSYLLVGTRAGSGPNALVALDPVNGTERARFDNSGAGLGMINGMAAVDYATRRVYFASHEWGGAGTNTLWCLQVNETTPILELKWARALGDIDSSPVLRNGRVYVGNNGTVFSIDALNGDNDLLDRKYVHNNGQVKGFVFPDRSPLSDDIYFATESYVWGVSDTDMATDMSANFPRIDLGAGIKPSAVLFVPGSHYVYFGASDAKLHEIDLSIGPVLNEVMLGSGPQTVGAPSLDRGYGLVHVGTESGVFYAVETPLPAVAMCFDASACLSNVGAPCYVVSPALCDGTCTCRPAGTCSSNCCDLTDLNCGF